MKRAVENTGIEFTVTKHLDLWSLKRESGIDGWTMVDCSVGADGLVYLLFSGNVPERINGMFVDTRANAHYRGIGLAVDWQDGTVLNPTTTDIWIMDTFDEAVRWEPEAHPLFHSDRGFQYTSAAFHIRLKEHHMKQSMSRVAHCIDNGPMEGLWLKAG